MKIKKSIAVSKSGFIFNHSTGDSYTVNQIAAEILKLLKESNSLEKVKEEILKNYDVNEHETAKVHTEKVVNIYPFDCDAVVLLGWINLKMEDYRKAKILFNKNTSQGNTTTK